MLGGGTFTAMNKDLPGSYINFVSASQANSEISDRGIAAMALELDWGPENEVFEMDAKTFQEEGQKLLGYRYTAEQMQGLRDLFTNVRKLYAYRLNSGGTRAANDLCTAKYAGTRGNDLKIVVQETEDGTYEVKTLLGTVEVDAQEVAGIGALTDNDWVSFNAEAELAVTAGTPLTGGMNGDVSEGAYTEFFGQISNYSYNALGVVSADEAVKKEAAEFCRKMREDAGVKFQTVLYQYAADYEGVVNVKNSVSGDDPAALVYWVTGIIAACEVNKSNQNKAYTGEYEILAPYSQLELTKALRAGEFVLHRVGQEFRVLDDVNSLVTLTEEKGEVFQNNQTIRVIDQIANDIAVIFNDRYFGKVQNDQSGRVSLWAEIVKHHQELAKIRAIEDFSEDDVTVSAGETKKSVIVTDAITVVNTMAQLYMTVKVS